ncbi:low-density lipoprotein receptor-related protein 1 isoform X2 [Strongylocentrotus purpuratus]|uniref:EGF-like domain-containing protein n=1 Tax=Strongylocentrotus purpuratus TaxID=7668 RepID=A0A7M7N258_STRPU|nr:low-density lipoprotein receptor-related protein 1 isoform X1 [Strongylocentrotus purpuratus]XP_030830160.1 low-density lipoprotein receptor-related protein 1 isoform X2 [Strongylocentrotus purpuratus]
MADIKVLLRYFAVLLAVYPSVHSECDGMQYECVMSRTCIESSRRCDGVADCPGADDELSCSIRTPCRADYEHCPGLQNNLCIDPSWRCDSKDDCEDNSDEDANFCATTACPSSFVSCVSDKKCIPGDKFCDGQNDCADRTDEPAECTDGTSTWQCPDLHFKCNNSRCISDLKVCDGVDDCTDGSDESMDCSDHVCRSGYFTCPVKRFNGERCIPTNQVCDGVAQCEYAEDEDDDTCMGTNDIPCSGNEFTCANDLCILMMYECDHYNDCGDSSDEHDACDYPECSTVTQFKCGNGVCVSVSQRCDGNNDCRDGSDESDCPSCNDNQFTCENGQCVAISQVCDGSVHCEDGSDERFCGIDECMMNRPCSDTCVDTLTSFKCMCNKGFVLASDRVTCIDFDECTMTPICSQVCVNTPGSYICSCTTGYQLQSNGSCMRTTGEDPTVLIANRYYVRQFDTETPSDVNNIVAQDFEFAVALDYDIVDNKLFVSDVVANTIVRMDMNAQNREVIIDDDAGSVEGIAVDWVGRKIYFSDRPRRILEVAEMNGSSRRVLKRTNLFEVRAVAVDPKHGNMYWTDWGLRAYIGRMGMDGTNPIEIHNENIAWPNGITVDYTADRIYWTDAHLDHISFADLEGNNIHELANDDSVHRIAHPFSIAVFDEWVYWTEWNIKKVYRAHKLTGLSEMELVTTIHRPFDINIYHSLKQDTTLQNPCGTNNGGCSHLCVIAAGGNDFTCLCPDNYVLENGVCVERCSDRQFHCSADADCIPWYYECNGYNDCSDGEDERDCGQVERVCDPSVFQCDGNDRCIPIPWLCDGDNDCQDVTISDESHCSTNVCEDWEFKCNSGKCIPRREVCDRDDDCPDGDDEEEVMCTHPNRTCEVGYFSCANGFCVPDAWVCDLDNDCGDMSDEPSHLCYQSTCAPGWFSCADSYRCIPSYVRCNGFLDCRGEDDSDEEGCPEVTCDPIGDFRCDNHKCIPKRWECDFNNDCGDRSDEYEGCVYRDCSESEFRCGNERCIQGRKVCDGTVDCPGGLDEDDCNDVNCPNGYRACAFGTCINATLFCNGIRNCFDGSDESGCATTNPGCEIGEFRCTNNRCIPEEFKCDGGNECGDGSDESREACLTSQCDTSQGERFRCPSSGLCIWVDQLCDGYNNCGDSDLSDEQRCSTTACTADSFRCSGGDCVPFSALCNGNNDCTDNYDELGCDKEATCSVNNGDCEHICTPISSAGAILCQCRQGYVLAEDGHNCVDVNECLGFDCIQTCSNSKGTFRCSCSEGYTGQNNSCFANGATEYLIISDGQSIIRHVDGGRDTIVDHQSRIEGLDYMFETNTLYFTDSESRSIKRHSLLYNSDIAPENLAVDNVYLPVDISVDWIGRNIYFTDQGVTQSSRSKRQSDQIVADPYPKIAVADLEGLHERTLTKENVEKPTSVAVNPRRGYIYWADMSSRVGNAFIAMAYMNGENSEKVITDGLIQPRGLTVDFSNDDRVFWVDFKLNILQGMLFDGSNRKTLMSGDLSGDLHALYNPFHLEVFEDQFYWTASSSGEVRKANRLNPSKNLTEVSRLTNPGGLKMFQVNRYPQNIDNPCSGKNCRDLCLLHPSLSGKGIEASCDEGCNCENGGTCLSDGSCRCPNGLGGEFCTSPAKQTKSQVPLLAGVSSTLVIIIIVLVLLLLLYAYKRKTKSKRETTGGEVSYNNGNTNVQLNANSFPSNIPTASNPVYDNTFNPGPTTYDNRGFVPPMGAAGGPAHPGPQKTGLPGDEDLEAGALPDKEFSDAEKLAMYSSMYPNQPNYYVGMPPPSMPHAHMPEPPPAYRAEAGHGERVDDVHLDAPTSGNDERGLVDNEGQD